MGKKKTQFRQKNKLSPLLKMETNFFFLQTLLWPFNSPAEVHWIAQAKSRKIVGLVLKTFSS